MYSHHQGVGADSLDLFAAKAIVGTRDMGGDADFILPLRERVRSARFLVLRLSHPALCLTMLLPILNTAAV